MHWSQYGSCTLYRVTYFIITQIECNTCQGNPGCTSKGVYNKDVYVQVDETRIRMNISAEMNILA